MVLNYKLFHSRVYAVKDVLKAHLIISLFSRWSLSEVQSQLKNVFKKYKKCECVWMYYEMIRPFANIIENLLFYQFLSVIMHFKGDAGV